VGQIDGAISWPGSWVAFVEQFGCRPDALAQRFCQWMPENRIDGSNRIIGVRGAVGN
jgi:hypothetical protein